MSRLLRCLECGWTAAFDQAGTALMLEHRYDQHPETIPFPNHEHVGDAYDREHCVWTRADGERCWYPLPAVSDRTQEQGGAFVSSRKDWPDEPPEQPSNIRVVRPDGTISAVLPVVYLGVENGIHIWEAVSDGPVAAVIYDRLPGRTGIRMSPRIPQ